MSCVASERLAGRLDGELTENEARDVDAHLAACPRCAQRAQALRRLVAALPGAGPAREDARFVPEVLQRLEQRRERRLSARRFQVRAPRFAALAALAAAAAVAVFFVDGGRRTDEARGFVPRGGSSSSATGGAPAPRAAPLGLRVYRHSGGLQDERLELTEAATVRTGDGFSFELWNTTERPMQALLFGVDASAALHWFYPAWAGPDERPVSLSVPAHTGRIALPEGVTPEAVAPGRFVIIAVFSAEVLAAQRFEELVGGRGVDSLAELARARPDLLIQRVELTMEGVGP